jgi:hypothetical protein
MDEFNEIFTDEVIKLLEKTFLAMAAIASVILVADVLLYGV